MTNVQYSPLYFPQSKLVLTEYFHGFLPNSISSAKLWLQPMNDCTPNRDDD